MLKNTFATLASATQFIRLQRNQPQQLAAKEAGISLRTLQNIEAGKSVNASSLFAYLDYLGLLKDMLATLPDPNQLSPMELLKAIPHRRERAAGAKKKQTRFINAINKKVGFQWGDEK